MKTNNLIIMLCVVFIGGIVALVLWIKKNASTILADTASKTVEEMNNSNVSLKETLRNLTGVVLESQTDTIAQTASDKTKSLLNRWLKR